MKGSGGAKKDGWGGSRPGAGAKRRTNVPRCPCGAMTAKRAKARGHKCPGSIEAPDLLFWRMGGALKDVFQKLGGGEAFIKKERESFSEPDPRS